MLRDSRSGSDETLSSAYDTVPSPTFDARAKHVKSKVGVKQSSSPFASERYNYRTRLYRQSDVPVGTDSGIPQSRAFNAARMPLL
jgi:hypothetical protein